MGWSWYSSKSRSLIHIWAHRATAARAARFSPRRRARVRARGPARKATAQPPRIRPVSYTHLDVYQRQGRGGPAGGGPAAGTGLLRNPAPPAGGGIPGPVSYTHLDVYKRQVRYGSPARRGFRAGTVIPHALGVGGPAGQQPPGIVLPMVEAAVGVQPAAPGEGVHLSLIHL